MTEAEIDALGLTEQQKTDYNSLTEQDKSSLTKTAGSVYDSLSAEAKNVLATMSYGSDLNAVTLHEDQKEILNNLSSSELAAIQNVHVKQQQRTWHQRIYKTQRKI